MDDIIDTPIMEVTVSYQDHAVTVSAPGTYQPDVMHDIARAVSTLVTSVAALRASEEAGL